MNEYEKRYLEGKCCMLDTISEITKTEKQGYSKYELLIEGITEQYRLLNIEIISNLNANV